MGIFDQIKNAFGKAEPEPVTRKEAPAPTPEVQAEAPAEEASPSKANAYTVQSGDTLWKIAEEHYGDGNAYQKIFDANRDTLDSPDHILPGQELLIPK